MISRPGNSVTAHRQWIHSAVCMIVCVILVTRGQASDHADPSDPLNFNTHDERGLTGLFVFPVKNEVQVTDPREGDALVVILCVNRLLTRPSPYEGLDSFEFQILMDSKSDVRIMYPKDRNKPITPDERDTLRYGGLIPNSERIKPTLTISMQLKDDLEGSFSAKNFTRYSAVLHQAQGDLPLDLPSSNWGAGVRDDPFIFPPFFGTNVIAMALRLPYTSLPTTDGNLLFWATAIRRGTQIDHVGRSQRTQLPRFNLLNTLAPSEHVNAIRKMRQDPSLMQDITRLLVPTEFNFRAFDDQPDVMIFSKNQPAGYPNGRRLQDDVAKLACEQGGDCQLYELSFAKPRSPESERFSQYEGGRPVANDKPFLERWPYLAEPWVDATPPTPPGLTSKNLIIVISLGILVFAFVLLPWILYFRALGRIRLLRPHVTNGGAKPTQPESRSPRTSK